MLATVAVAAFAAPSKRAVCSNGRVASNAAVGHLFGTRLALADCLSHSAASGLTSWTTFNPTCKTVVVCFCVLRAHCACPRFDGSECGEEAHEVGVQHELTYFTSLT